MQSIGFTTHKPVVNNSLLFDACFNYVSGMSAQKDMFRQNGNNKSLNQIQLSNSGFTNNSDSENIYAFQQFADSTINPDSNNTIQQPDFPFDFNNQNNLPQDNLESRDRDTSKYFEDSSNVFPRGDSLKSLIDSTLAPDSLFLDSTARMEHFHYTREDVPYTELSPKKKSKFFAHPSTAVATRNVQLDSTGKFVEIVEKVANQQTKVLLLLPLDDYIKLRMDANNRSLWEQLAYKYELKEDKNDLSQLITDFTNISIPLPSAGFLSIFGPPKIDLQIGGAVDIHGAWRNETKEGISASLLGNSRNEPDFKQQVQINVSGTIGDKLSIRADWNTERTFEYENQLKLKYTGYEDEIVQNVEAGNVSLQTSPLVGGSEALFGIKADFQMGPLSLTTIASQKKGEVKEVAITGGSTSQTFEIHAYDYSKNHFFIDKIYADSTLNIFNNYYGNVPPQVTADDIYSVTEIEVWKTATGYINSAVERQVNAFIDLQPSSAQDYEALRQTNTGNPGEFETGRFIKLTPGTDFELHSATGYISFITQIQDGEAIAVAFRQQHNPTTTTDDAVYGEFTTTNNDTSKKLILKLIKPKSPGPQYQDAWQLQLKNIYPIGGRNVNEEGFEFKVVYVVPGSDPQEYLGSANILQAFGFDKYSSGGAAGADGIFDFDKLRTINTGTGEIIFPYLKPFGRDLPGELPNPDSLRYNKVYDDLVTFAKQDGSKDRFLLTGKYSASSSSVFNLGFVGVVENSVKVLLGGRELTPNVDFVVDYNIGQVTIKNAAALVPGADLRITYEQNDLFQLASKTLLGARGIFNFSPKTQFGFSMLNLNQQTLSDKVRIGEEPLNNSIYGMDFNTAVDLPFVTQGLNNIVSTKTMSSLSFRGEFAYINPDPNTKKSTIAGDLGESIAYIDDFEGAKRTIPIGVSFTSWRDLSVPDKMDIIGDSLKSVQMNYKAQSYWYNNFLSIVNVDHIWPERKTATGDEQVTVLDFVFNPFKKGRYNWYPNINQNPRLNWGGMMKVLSQTASNLIEENIEFIEFWIKLDSYLAEDTPPDALLYIDLGKISEDVIPNNRLDTEDKNKNDAVDEGEDLGLDGLLDHQEPGYDAATNPDPSGDNFTYNRGNDYETINNQQGNSTLTDAGGIFPDTEDLNRSGDIDVINSYFRYAVRLDTSKTTNEYITGGGTTPQKWYQIRIPLNKYIEKVGDPSFAVVEFIRLWVNNVDKPVHFKIAEFNLVGNQWLKIVDPNNPNDSALTLSVVNIEDNPGEYYLPQGLEREKDRSRPDQDIERNEQSLSLKIKDLKDGDERQVVKYLRSMDLFNYKEMKLFIHGDEDIASTISFYNDSSYASEVYFRFGSDTTNYYEYRLPVKPGWQDLSIKFSELSTLKSLRDSSGTNTTLKVTGTDDHYYQIRGNPALTKISFFMIGVKNPVGKGVVSPISGDVWVNELRVIGADNASGWAYSSSAKLNLGDVMNINFNMSQTDPYFHRLSDRFGSRLDSRNWGFNMDLDILKLLPFNMPGSNLRVNYSRTEQIAKPLYVPGTDIKVDKAASLLAQTSQERADSLIATTRTLNISDTWTVSGVKLKVPSQSWIWNYTLNSLTFNFNFNKTRGKSPTISLNNSWVWNGGINYSINLGQNNFFYPADIPILGTILDILDYRQAKVYYTPQSISWNLTAKRNYSYNLQRSRSALPLVSRDFTTARNAQMSWKLTEGGFLNLTMTYGFDFASSLAHLLTEDINGNLVSRSESEIWNDIFTKAFFGRNYQYQQSFGLRPSPKLPGKLNNYITLTMDYSSNYTWQNNFQQAELGRSAGFSNKISAGMSFKLKSLFAPLFKDDETDKETSKTNQGQGRNNAQMNQGRGNRGRETTEPQEKITEPPEVKRREEAENKDEKPVDLAAADSNKVTDSLNIALTDSIDEEPKTSPFKTATLMLKSGIKWALLDYETIQINFSQDNTVQKSGLKSGASGFNNFWGIYNEKMGPSRSFMLGLSQDIGPRALAIGTNLTDNISQRNNVELKTARPLWEGANIDIRWKVGWQFSKSQTIRMDEEGNIVASNPTSTGSISRSFVLLPLSFTGSGIKKVNELYNSSQDLTGAFVEGMETFPLLSKLPFLNEFTKYIPRPNWSINWDGLEKYSIFKSFAKRVSLQHAYTSDYSEGWRTTSEGTQVTQSQKVNYGFAPLLGLNMTFQSLWEGNFTGSIKYSTKTGYDLGASTTNITESFSRDIGISASYSKSGFEIPLFGLSLKNDIEITFSYTLSKNSIVIFNMGPAFKEGGTPQDGTLRTTMEPRIKYVMSSKVTASIFYRRSSVTPEGASRITPTTTNEMGLDVHIAIQQ